MKAILAVALLPAAAALGYESPFPCLTAGEFAANRLAGELQRLAEVLGDPSINDPEVAYSLRGIALLRMLGPVR